MKRIPDPLLSSLSQASEAVLGTAMLIALGVWGGAWLDDRLHTSPWLTISLSILGMTLGLTRMIMKALKGDLAASKRAKGDTAHRLTDADDASSLDGPKPE